MERRVCGWVNGEPCYSSEEFVYRVRGFGAIESDEALIEYAKKVTWNWQDAGWCRSFTTFYLSDWVGAEPRAHLTKTEFARLVELQKIARAEEEAADKAREWQLVGNEYYADNSVVEVWRDKNGVEKRVTVVGAHGDLC